MPDGKACDSDPSDLHAFHIIARSQGVVVGCVRFMAVPNVHGSLIAAAHFQVTGGTGRFHGATGVLTLTETATPIASDASGNPIFFTEKGEFTGTITRGGDTKP